MPENFINRQAVAQGLPSTPIVGDVPSYSEISLPGAGAQSINDMVLGGIKASNKVAEIPLSSFYIGDRYKETRPGTDYEEAAGQQQSSYDKFRNGIVKMAGVATTSFASGTAGLIYGIGSAYKDQRLASLIDNPVTQEMDSQMKYLEDLAPNYYTHSETDASFLSPKNILTANFFSDKIIKNLGYSLGAMAGGVAWGAVLRKIGITNALVRAGQGLEAATAVEASMLAVPNARKYAALQETLTSLGQKYIKSPIGSVLKDSDRILTSAMGTFGEASIEGLQGMNAFRNKAIQDYKDVHGFDPSQEELDRINETTDRIGLYIWGANSLLLTGTNYIQLPKILGSSKRADKALINELGKDVETGLYKQVTPTTKFGKLFDGARNLSGVLFARSEALEEGLQSSIQTGVTNYFQRAYDNKEKSKDFLTTLNESMQNVFGEGIENTLTTKDGLESILIGGLSGGLQQAGYVGVYKNDKGNLKLGIGKTGIIGERGLFGNGGEKKENTAKAIQSLNKVTTQQALQDQVKFLSIGIGSQQLRQEAIKQDDTLSEKDYEQDFTLSYLMPRAKYGKVDSVLQELDYYESQTMSEEGFTELQTSGIASQKESKNQFLGRISSLKLQAKNVDRLYEALNDKYENKLNSEGQLLYTDDVIDKLVYAASKVADYDTRIPQLNTELKKNLIDTTSILQGIYETGRPSRETIDSALKQINSLDTVQDEKNDLKSKLSDVIELSLRRKLFIDEYNEITKKPLNYQEQDSDAPRTSSIEIDQKQKVEGKRNRQIKKVELEVGKEYSLNQPIYKKNNELYLAPKITVLSTTLGGEYEVKLPNSKITFLTPTEFKEYSISTSEDNTDEQLKDALDKAITEVLKTEKFSSVSIPEEVNDKLQYINSLNNKELIDAIEKDFNSKTKTLLETREKERIAKDKLIAEKETLDRQQKELELSSGQVGTVSTEPGEYIGSGEKRKDVDVLFLSTSSPTEGTVDKPHIQRAITFVNNVKFFKNKNDIKTIIVTPNNAEELGLSGIVQLSYGKQLTDSLTENETDVDTGFMAQVSILQLSEGDFFVDQDGNKISKVGDKNNTILDKVIFQTMTSASLYTEGGYEKVRAGQEEQAQTALEAYKIFRKQLFAQKGYTPYSFAISRGIADLNKIDGQFETLPVSSILGPNSEDIIANHDGLISVVITGKVENNGELLSFPPGTTLIKYGDLLDFVNNRLLTTKQSSTIYSVIEATAKDLVEKSNKNLPLKIDFNYSKFLQNVLFWKSDAKTQNPSQIGIDTTAMTFKIGKNSFPLLEIEKNKKEILEALQEAFINVNNDTLNKGTSIPFTEYVLNEEGLSTVQWKNYQSYLISSKTPDGKSRPIDQIPLITHTTSYKQKYQYITDRDVLPYDKVPVKEKAATTSSDKIGEYVLDGTTSNTFKLNTGDVSFTGTISPEGIINVNVNNNETINKLSIEQALVDAVDKNLQALPEELVPDNLSKLTNEDKAKLFVKIRIESELGKQLEQPVEKTIPTPIVQKQEEEYTPLLDFDLAKGKTVYDETRNEGVIKAFKVNKDGEHLDAVLIKWKTGKEQWLNNGSWYGALFEKNKNFTPAVVEEEQPKTLQFNPNFKFGQRDNAPEYRLVGNSVGEQMTPSDLETFKQWHQENVPNIPFQVLDRIVNTIYNTEAWGVFEDGVAKFVKGGLRGTEYHEIFEGIWAGFLSEKQQQELIKEFREKKGEFIDRASGIKYEYSDPYVSDKIVKERIADDFADFRINKITAKSLGDKFMEFFRKVINFFRTFSLKPNLKNQLFKAIDSGRFKETKLSNRSKTSPPEYRAIEGLSEEQTNDFIQDMVSQVKLIIFGEGRKDLLFNPEKLTGEEVFSKVREIYTNLGAIEALGEKRYIELVRKANDFLRTIGINFNEDEIVSINNEESNNRDYAPEAFSTDWKQHSTGAIKFLLSTLTERKPLNQSNVKPGKPLAISDVKRSSIDGYKLLNFNKVFVTLFDRLHNTNSPKIFADKLVQLTKEDSNYLPIFRALGGNLVTHSFDFDSFKESDWRLFIQFFNTFTRQKPEALIQYISEEGDVYTSNANIFSTINTTVNSWVNNMKIIGKSENNIINYDKKEKVYRINTDFIKKVSIKKPKEMIDFLSSIGVDFSIETYNALSDKDAIVKGKLTSELKTFTSAVASIYTQLGSNNDLMSFDSKRLQINGPLRTLAALSVKVNNPNQESTYFGVEGQRIGSFAENNAPSFFENTFNEANTLEELLLARPELNDVYSRGSEILKKGGLFFDATGKRIAEIKVEYIQGTKNQFTGKDKSTSKLTRGERFIQEINQNINGKYYVLIPGDSSTEWMMNLGNVISMDDIQANTYWDKVYKIYNSYLIDEINLGLDNRKQNLYTRNKSTELRILKDILPQHIVTDIETMIKGDYPLEEIQEFVINKNRKEINESIKEFIEANSKETLNILLDTNQVLAVDENEYILNGIDTQFLKQHKLNDKATYEEALNVIRFVNINYQINNQEYHKILFGDPYQFKSEKGKLDETKRIKSFLSPRRRTFDMPEYNNFLREQYNIVDNIVLDEGVPGNHSYKPFTNTVTFADVDIVGSIATLPNVPKEIKKAFSKTNETDAVSWLMDNTHKEIGLKEGQWSEQAEKFHQWHMAYTRRAFDKKGLVKYTNQALQEHDNKLLSSPIPKYKLAVRKPIISGNKNNKVNIDLVLDKTSQMPLYYHMVEDTNLESMYVQMFKQNIGYGIVISGRKVGTEEIHPIYNTDGSFNTAPFSNIIEVPWKIYGTQVETMSEGEKTQTRGSQATKLSSMDLFDNGEAVSPEAEKAYERNTKALNELNDNAYNELLDKLGIQDLGNAYVLENNEKVSDTLMYEMLRRQLSENAKDTIQLDEETKEFLIPFEASPSYFQIKNILYSLVNKALISPSMNGAPHVQVPVTMFEKATKGRSLAIKTETGWSKITKNQYNELSEEDKKKVLLTDDTLKFYTPEDPYCEVMLPAWFKNKLKNRFKSDEELLNYLNNTKEGKRILTGIGFRIPTQALSSMEVFRVKGFLPDYMGYTVVVPSEITTKAGSDFDIDKLNMYLKSIYLDENNNVKLVTYKGTEQATKDFYANVFDNTIQKEIDKIQKYDEFRETLFSVFNTLEDLSYPLTKDQQTFYDDHQSMIEDIIEQADEAQQLPSEYILNQISLLAGKEQKLNAKLLSTTLRDAYVNKSYKKALENEYYESLEELLTLPENFDRLISPVDDAGLEAESELLDEKRGYNETNIKARLINRNYITNLRHAFITGKRWVGIAAVNITNLSLRQKSKVYLDPVNIPLLSQQEKRFVKNLDIVLPHNTVNVDGVNYTSLSGTKTEDGSQFISDRLSGYATAFVDIANKPFITKIIKSDVIVSTFMFLESIGAGNKGIYFLNQPIIEKYLEHLDSINSKNVLNNTNLKYIRTLFPTTGKDLTSASISVDQLLDNIQEYSKGEKLSSLKNAEQQLILNEFVKYKILADQLFSYTQAVNYDTTKFGGSDALLKKEWATFNVSNTNLISNVDDVLSKTFIGNQASLLSKAFSSFGTILKTEQPEIKAYTLSTLKKYATRKYMSADDYEKISILIKNSFLDYIIQNNTSIRNMIEPLLINPETSVVNQLEKAKQKYPSIQLLQDLIPVLGNRPGSAQSIQLKSNPKDAYSENMYVGMMRELRDTNKELNALYNDIVNTAILQGTTQSSISLRNIIPLEDYSERITPIIQQLNANSSLEEFSNGMFERNNFANKDLFLEHTPYTRESETSNFDPMTGEEISIYYMPNFKKMKGVTQQSRQIITLNETYDSFKIASDFIKIPKVITNRQGKKINVTTGLIITPRDYAVMKEKGSFYLYDAYYYKKVYTNQTDQFNNSLPLTTPGKDKYGNSLNNYYYKLINVYGDGNRATEHNTNLTPSIINNGSIKVEKELTDTEIVAEFAPEFQEESLPLLAKQTPSLPEYNEEDRRKAELEQRIQELEVRKELIEGSTLESVVINSLPKINPESAKKETGLKTGNTKDIPTSFLSKNGVTVDQAAHDIWENNPNFDIQEIRDVIIDILNSKSLKAYKDSLNKVNELQDLKEKLKTKPTKADQLDLFSDKDLGLDTDFTQEDFKC